MENDKEVQEQINVVAEEPILHVNGNLMDESPEADHELEIHEEDYSQFTKTDFIDRIKELAKETDFKRIDQVLKEIKPLFDEIRHAEKSAALERFKLDGGNPDDFEYRLDELDHTFDGTLKLIRDRRNQYYKTQEETRNENLRKKNELLERLRALVDGEDNAQTFNRFKEIQQEWRQIGTVPPAHSKTLWANYHALVDRFYDHRNIYFELKELDRKKNLESKLELCAKAEQLITRERIKDAVRELNELHNEFKHLGPVPQEAQEGVWQRFKGASDAVYAKRDAFLDELQKGLKQNLEAKLAIGEEVQAFTAFASDRIKDWNQKTQEILALQKKWDGVGGVPRAKSKEANKKFWGAFKTFFHNKNQFFKKLDEERDKNLKAKQELVARALELKSSDDWNKTSQELKVLQQHWKDIGPVPEKMRDRIYKEFKEACDYFFEQRRGNKEKADHEQDENLKRKESVIELLISGIQSGTPSMERLQELQAQFNEIGFVPRSAMSSVKNRFSEAVSKYVASIPGLNTNEKEKAVLEVQLSGLKDDPQAERKLFHKEQHLRKQIQKAENDLSTLQNNLEFFGRSKSASKMKEEFADKIAEASENLKQLKNQLKLLKSI